MPRKAWFFDRQTVRSWRAFSLGNIGLALSDHSGRAGEVMGQDVMERSLVAVVGKTADSPSCAVMFVMNHPQCWFIDYGEGKRPALFSHRNFFPVEEQIAIKVAARLEKFSAEDEERPVRR